MDADIATGPIYLEFCGYTDGAREIVVIDSGLVNGFLEVRGAEGRIGDQDVKVVQAAFTAISSVPDADFADVRDGFQIDLPPRLGFGFRVSDRTVAPEWTPVAIYGFCSNSGGRGKGVAGLVN
jgi:hypothetical protein